MKTRTYFSQKKKRNNNKEKISEEAIIPLQSKYRLKEEEILELEKNKSELEKKEWRMY